MWQFLFENFYLTIFIWQFLFDNFYLTIFIWKFLFDNFYLTIFVCWLSPVYTSNFYVTSFIYFPVYTPFTRAIFIWKQKIGNWDLRLTLKIANSMCCVVYTDNFLYVTIFVCQIKTNVTRRFFSKYNCHKKNWPILFIYMSKLKIVIKIARVDGALSQLEQQKETFANLRLRLGTYCLTKLLI